jgi:hypothetical protein
MSNEYIKMIEERLLEMREKEAKKLSPAQKKHLDKDDDGDIDSKDFEMLRKKKSESSEKMTPCPKCEGSMENHDPECPSHPDNKGGDSKEEGCGDYSKKMKKEEVEQVDEGKIDKSSPMYKEYQELKKMPIKQLRNKVALVNRGDDVKGYDKEGAVSEILRAKYGKKKVDKVFGFNEEVQVDENRLLKVNTLSSAEYQRAKKLKGFDKSKYTWDSKQQLYIKEEVEQVDELKTSTVKSYVTKATKDRNVNKAHGMSHADSSQTFNNFGDGKKSDSELKKANKRFAKADKRQSGLDRAKKRYNEDAEQVVSEQWGFGEVIETTENGLNVYFEHGVEFNVPAEELTFVQESADRAKHYKGATKPETMLDKYKGAGAKKMATDNNVDSPKEAEITPEEEGHQDAVKAGKVTKQAPTRGGEPRKGDLKIVNPVKENYRTLATKGMGAETKKSINVGRQVDYFHPSNGDKKQGTITKIHATGYHVKDDNDGKTHKFDFHDRAKAKGLL